MDDVSIVGLDLAKRVFQVHSDAMDGRVVSQEAVSRSAPCFLCTTAAVYRSDGSLCRQPISGPVRSARSATRCGWYRLHT